VMSLVDLAQRTDVEFPNNVSGQAKLTWLLIVLLTGIIGGFVYYVMIMRKYPRGTAYSAPVQPQYQQYAQYTPQQYAPPAEGPPDTGTQGDGKPEDGTPGSSE
jgi:hypothetical protein